MKTFLAILTTLNFIFIIDLIFFNSYCIKKVRDLKKFIPNIIKKLIDIFKGYVYKKLFNEEEKNEKFNNERYQPRQPDPTLIESEKNLKTEISNYLKTKPNFLIENFNPHLSINTLLSRINKLTIDEIYLLETIKIELEKIDYTQISDQDLAVHYNEINNLLYSYESIHTSYKDGMKKFYDSVWDDLTKEINKFRRLNEVLKNVRTSHIYLKAERNFSMAFYIYFGLTLITIAGALHFSLYALSQKNTFMNTYGADIYDFWTLKIASIFIFITLITFFIKQATYYQKKKDQAQRTRLELDALPTYVFDFKDEEVKKIRKELIPKYFGNNSDQSTLNEIGNIVTEQLKTSSDVAKSSADIIKTLKNKI